MLVSCRRTAPQSPANKTHAEDPIVAMTLVNMRMTEEADKQCTEYVKHTGQPYVLTECSCWILRNKRTDGVLFKKGDTVALTAEISTLDSLMIENSEIRLEIGKNDALPCFDYILPLLHEGENVTAVVPFYLAYGKDGKGNVPPLTNCLITISDITLVNE